MRCNLCKRTARPFGIKHTLLQVNVERVSCWLGQRLGYESFSCKIIMHMYHLCVCVCARVERYASTRRGSIAYVSLIELGVSIPACHICDVYPPHHISPAQAGHTQVMTIQLVHTTNINMRLLLANCWRTIAKGTYECAYMKTWYMLHPFVYVFIYSPYASSCPCFSIASATSFPGPGHHLREGQHGHCPPGTRFPCGGGVGG